VSRKEVVAHFSDSHATPVLTCTPQGALPLNGFIKAVRSQGCAVAPFKFLFETENGNEKDGNLFMVLVNAVERHDSKLIQWRIYRFWGNPEETDNLRIHFSILHKLPPPLPNSSNTVTKRKTSPYERPAKNTQTTTTASVKPVSILIIVAVKEC